MHTITGQPITPVFNPRPCQLDAFKARANGYTRGITIAHRRWGKDLRFWNMLWMEALKRKGLYNYYFPTFSLGKKIVWKGMDKNGRRFLDYIPADLIKDRNESDLRLELMNGSIIQIIGTENLNANLVGINPVGAGFSEYPLCSPLAWEYTRPILTENGGWAWFMYTPRGRNHGWTLYQNALRQPDRWFVEVWPITKSTDHDGRPLITHEQYLQEIADGMDPDLAAQEFLCSFDAPMQGSYYGHAIKAAIDQGRLTTTPWIPDLPVVTAWDLGVADTTAIWFAQVVRERVHIIDYYEQSGHGFDHYFHEVMSKPYRYARHYFPHDVARTDWGTGHSSLERVSKAFLSRGCGVTVLPRLTVLEGIEAARRLFPLCQFDTKAISQTTYRGHTAWDALTSYRKEWNEARQEYSDKPLHDWASNAADAFRYLAIGIRTTTPAIEPPRYISTARPGLLAEAARDGALYNTGDSPLRDYDQYDELTDEEVLDVNDYIITDP